VKRVYTTPLVTASDVVRATEDGFVLSVTERGTSLRMTFV